MRPISNLSFGQSAGKMAITFHNGTAVVTGHIVKQMGTKTFLVSKDGVATFKVDLAQTTDEATTLVAGKATIKVTPFGGAVEYARSFQSKKVVTTAGNTYPWALGPASVTGYAGVLVVPALLAITGVPAAATSGTAYSFQPVVTGGAGTKVFSSTGTLPAGLTLSTSTGAISGTPTAAGTSSGIVITVVDDSGTASLSGLSIVVG